MIVLVCIGMEAEEGMGRVCALLSENEASVVPGVTTVTIRTAERRVSNLSRPS